MQRTLAIIKPDAVEAGKIGTIVERIESEGFRIVGLRRMSLSVDDAGRFYEVHRERPFYKSLTGFMSSGPIVVMVLEAEDAIVRWRTVMGATDPANADDGTLRKLHATSIEKNATHGSDAPETAAQEIGFFFSALDL